MVGVFIVTAVILVNWLSRSLGLELPPLLAVLVAAIGIFLFERYIAPSSNPAAIWEDTFFLAPMKWWPAILVGIIGLGITIRMATFALVALM